MSVYVATDLLFGKTATRHPSLKDLSLCFLGGLLYCGHYLWQAMKKEKDNPIRQERLRHLLFCFTIVALGTEGLLRAFVAYDASSPIAFLAR